MFRPVLAREGVHVWHEISPDMKLDSVPPRKPEPEECCGQGCKSCVFDVYENELRIWEQGGEVSSCDEVSQDVYSEFVLTAVSEDTSDTKIFSFSGNVALSNVCLGDHLICRESEQADSPFLPYLFLRNGRMNEEFVREQLLELDRDSTSVLVCGSRDFQRCVTCLSKDLGFSNVMEF
ncbi:unnamed protein product [Notodromas monacha]|uniref:Oxidoreductase-like domain-containing protein n=1 Tax=Notodromas monacha TaxID=399045 RepID=A0A7R9BCS9_9CRUS|nr:unnamed protein product [Notodromas monacha]CAG0912917.1 unnamed protein product [Notodromas monacha]